MSGATCALCGEDCDCRARGMVCDCSVCNRRPGRPPSTDRSPGRGGRAVRVNLSATEHAAYVAAAHPLTVSAWMRALALAAVRP